MAEEMSYVAYCRHGYMVAAAADDRNLILRHRLAQTVGEWLLSGARVERVSDATVKAEFGRCDGTIHGPDCERCDGLGSWTEPVPVPEQQELFDAPL